MMILEMLVVGENSRFTERIVIHPTCSRKIDTFIKCFDIRKSDGNKPKKGEAVLFMPGTVVGTRGWCLLKETEFEFKSGDKGVKNEIAVFHTDRDKFPKVPVKDLLASSNEEEDTSFD